MAARRNRISEDEWKIVKARIERMPSNLKLHLGGLGSFDKNDLIKEIEKKSDVGQLLVKINFNYLRTFKEEASGLNW